MSSGFVSGGTIDDPTKRDDEWVKAQQELEAERRRKAEEAKQDGGKSLYEILQRNKAAKQEAFEESIKLKNQFRALDEDEVEFLDSVLESTRAQEEALKRETREQLEIFHRQRQEAEKVLVDITTSNSNGVGTGAVPTLDEEQWVISARKRRRAKNKDIFPGVKRKKSSSTDAKSSTINKAQLEGLGKQSQSPPSSASMLMGIEKPEITEKTEEPEKSEKTETTKVHDIAAGSDTPISSVLGLGAYSSDGD
ncbi:hypothetical protein PABG_03292 [Paracoccidioides brasiliensis Pb03]|nr:hypothetical protein PABG_03292 [Paracoccidioides brasiliensis Pb03]